MNSIFILASNAVVLNRGSVALMRSATWKVLSINKRTKTFAYTTYCHRGLKQSTITLRARGTEKVKNRWSNVDKTH